MGLRHLAVTALVLLSSIAQCGGRHVSFDPGDGSVYEADTPDASLHFDPDTSTGPVDAGLDAADSADGPDASDATD